MEAIMSNWSNVQSMPENYILPLEKRPGTFTNSPFKDIPIIDLERINEPAERAQIIHQIMKASQDFGIFQVINHEVSRDLTDQTMDVFKSFFASPSEYKAKFYSHEWDASCRLFTSTLNYEKEEFHYWRDNITHKCRPLEDHIKHWPETPPHYRQVVGEYSIEMKKFLLTVLGLICEGLGLETSYLEGEMSNNQLVSVNHHIPCPDPSLTLGMNEHVDINLITVVQQGDVPGFQALHDGQWVGVKPLPYALIVIPGTQLRVISNGKLASAVHRVVTNSKESRTTIGTFLSPTNDILIQPANGLFGSSTPLYRGFTYKEFFTTFLGTSNKVERTLDYFKL